MHLAAYLLALLCGAAGSIVSNTYFHFCKAMSDCLKILKMTKAELSVSLLIVPKKTHFGIAMDSYSCILKLLLVYLIFSYNLQKHLGLFVGMS